MISAAQKDDQLLADIRRSNTMDHHFRLWWLGQSGFLVQYQGHHLLLDPYLSDSLTEKYKDTDKPHIRMTELVVDPARLNFVDVVTSSHAHTDHLDGATLRAILAANPRLQVVVARANLELAAERLGVGTERITTLDAGESIAAAGFTLHAIPAAHETLERDPSGCYRYLGYVAQFGPWSIYHSGDTLRYAELEQWLGRWRIDLALLPINGRAPERRVAGNLWGDEAARLAHDIGARMVIPCHYEMFTFNTASPDAFEAACRSLGQPFRTLRCGERWSSEEIGG